MIVGLSGPAGCGKSTAAAHLCMNYGFARRRFAGPLKAMMFAFGCTIEQVEGDLKGVPCDLLGGKTPRQAMQYLGTEWGRDLMHPDLWLNAWVASLPAQGDVVADDVRFPNEVEAIKSRGGIIICISGRGGIPGSHVSEGFVPDGAIHIDNSSTPENFFASLEAAIGLKQAA